MLLVCLDKETGKILWRNRGVGRFRPIGIDTDGAGNVHVVGHLGRREDNVPPISTGSSVTLDNRVADKVLEHTEVLDGDYASILWLTYSPEGRLLTVREIGTADSQEVVTDFEIGGPKKNRPYLAGIYNPTSLFWQARDPMIDVERNHQIAFLAKMCELDVKKSK